MMKNSERQAHRLMDLLRKGRRERQREEVSMAFSIDELVQQAQSMVISGTRTILGITGIPGAGKSTLAEQLADRLSTVVVPMDGFHLSNRELAAQNLMQRKGAPETFDIAGFLECLRKLKSAGDKPVQCPRYSREIHEPVPDAVTVRPDHQLIIVEGNYLLLQQGGWVQVRHYLDAVWFVDIDIETAMDRVCRRHGRKNKTSGEIEKMLELNDRPNALLIEQTKPWADMLITVEDLTELNSFQPGE